MAERHRRRYAGLARKYLTAVLRGEQAEVEEVALESPDTLDFPARDLGQAK